MRTLKDIGLTALVIMIGVGLFLFTCAVCLFTWENPVRRYTDALEEITDNR